MTTTDIAIDPNKQLKLHLRRSFSLEIDDDLIEPLIKHIQTELERDYTASIGRKGHRFYPSAFMEGALDGEELNVTVSDKTDCMKVHMTLPIFDWEGGFSYISCTCNESLNSFEVNRCWHMWVAQNALINRLQDELAWIKSDHADAENCQQKSMLDFLADYSDSLNLKYKISDLPSGQSSSCSVSTINGNPEGSLSLSGAELAAKGRIVFQWIEDGTIHPATQHLAKASQRGLKPLSWENFLKQRSTWQDPVYHMAAGHLEAYVGASGQLSYRLHLLGLLKVLAGTRLLFLKAKDPTCEQDSRSLQVSEQSLSLSGRIEDGQLRLYPLLSDLEVNFVLEDGSGIVAFSHDQLYFAAVDPKTADFVKKLIDKKVGIDLQQRELILSYLSQVEKQVTVNLDPSLVDEVRPAFDHIHLRITPFEQGGARIEMLCRPGSGTDYFPPATGPEQVMAVSTNGKSYLYQRDFFAERDRANHLYEHLKLRQFRPFASNAWLLTDTEALLDILSDVETCRQSDLVVEWPESIDLKTSVEKAPDLGLQPIVVSVGEKKDWFSVDAQISHDSSSVDLKALLEALKKSRRYVQLRDGRWSKISEALKERLEGLNKCLDYDEENGILLSPAVLEQMEEMREKEAIQVNSASRRWVQMRESLRSSYSIDSSLPEKFQGELRPYQYQGFKWMNRLYHRRLGGCLADDMGLGKTVQTLALLLKQSSHGPSVVVAPTSLSANWRREAERFCPTISVLSYRDSARSAAMIRSLKKGDLLLISYGLLLRDQEILSQRSWNIIVIDEAQAIKNARSKTARALQGLRAHWLLALTGTPIENHLGDLWSLFRTISPGLLGSWEKFRKSYALPTKVCESEIVRERLKVRISPFILRRMKQDYLKELPPKTVINLRLTLSRNELDLYHAIRLEAIERLGVENDVDQPKKEDKQEESKRRFSVLASLTRMRLACIHGHLVDPDWAFESTKIKTTQNLLIEARENGRRALIFSQFTSVLKILETWIKNTKLSYTYLDGAVSVSERERRVRLFQEGDMDVFLISLKAGGSGLNLTKADLVIHLDPWWNPAVQEQATDRAYRMGQTNPVTVYHLIAESTVEERMHELQNEKRSLAGDVLEVARGEASFSQNELMALLRD